MRYLHTTCAVLTTSLVLGCASTPETKSETASATTDSKAKPAEAPLPEVPVAEKWRAKQPEPGPLPKLVIPTFEQAKLKNGLSVFVHERRALPLVSMGLVVRAGSAAESLKQEGLADLTYELMAEGAAGKDGPTLANAFADLGAELQVATGADSATFTLTVLSRNSAAALKLLGDVVMKPTLGKDDFGRKQKEALANLQRALDAPPFLLINAMSPEVFGAEHPYGHYGLGTADSLKGLKLADVKKFYKQRVGPKVSAVVFSGDINAAEAKKLAQKVFGKWRGPAKPQSAPKAPVVAARSRVLVVAKPGLPQTVIGIGRPGMVTGSDDHWPLEVANEVFGGMFSSRLNMNLREDKGVTYGARAWLDKRYGVGALVAYSPVQADATGTSLGEFFKELEGMNKSPVTEAEYAQAREGLLRSLPGSFESGGKIVGSLATLFARQQPLDYYNQLAAKLEALTIDQVRAAATKYYDPAVMKIVMVGDPDLIKKQVSGLELGALEVQPPPQ